MSDFDTRLRTALKRLDAAVPPAGQPSPGTVPFRRSRRARQVVVLLAATVALLVGTAVATISAPAPRDPGQIAADAAAEERLDADLGRAMAGGCISFIEARSLVRERLDALGYAGWRIETRDGAEKSRCVGAAVVGDDHLIILLPSMGADVAAAMDGVRAELMRSCLDRAEATRLISSTLAKLGVTGWSVGDDGRLVVPIGQEEAVRRHIAQGCFVYSGSQSTPDGGRAFYISGP